MDKALLDTDIFSEILKGKNPKIAAKAAQYRAVFGRLTISVITVLEVVKGFHKIGAAGRLNKFLNALAALEILPLDQEAAVLAGQIYADLEKTGQPVGRADPMIAAIAISSDCALVTGNTEHFGRILTLGYALKLDDWRK